MYTKKNTRVTFRSNRRPNFKRNSNFSNSKPRNKGNVTQQYNKYLKMAKDASTSGDRIQSEYYYQFTDHYYRLMIELGINLEESDVQENRFGDNNSESDGDEFNASSVEKKEDETETDSEPDNSAISNSTDSEEADSIDSIPFISKPAKKKSTRIKKVS